MSETLNSSSAVRRLGLRDDKPAHLKVYRRGCEGVTPEEISSVLHARLSTLCLHLEIADSDEDQADVTLWLRAIQETNHLTSLRQLILDDYFAHRFLPQSFIQTTLSPQLANLSVLIFQNQALSPRMCRWAGTMMLFIQTLGEIKFDGCTFHGQLGNLLSSLLTIHRFWVSSCCEELPVEVSSVRGQSTRELTNRGHIWLNVSHPKHNQVISRCVLSKIEKWSRVTTNEQLLNRAEIPHDYRKSLKYLAQRG